ncbi:MAG: RNA polymerase sigma factor [Sedimentisphaerales bacterium]|nr:RNA polymerase sigma factor [Sedimentisphaerales bacterium]
MKKNRVQQDISSIIAGCKKGESQSFTELVNAYSNRLYGFFFRLSGNKTTSDDLLSELFVKLVEKIDTFGGGNFDGWIFTVASNIWHDWLRNKFRGDKALAGLKEQTEYETNQQKVTKSDNEILDRLGRELEKIDDETRELIVLRFYSQLSFKEIASIRSEPIGTVLSKVHRGLKKLRQSIGQYNYE